MLYHAHIIGVENIGALIFRNLEILSRAGLLHKMVFPPAGLGALPAIGISVCKIVGKQTPTGKGDTHSAVHKCFQAKILRGIDAYLTYLVEGQLPCKNHRVGPLIVKEVCCSTVDNTQLGADMLFNMGGVFFCQRKDTEICDNQGIHACRLQKRQIFREPLQLVFSR